MEISFADDRLQKRCESQKELRRAYGDQCAKKVMTRLADLTAAATLQEFRSLPGRCHELAGDRDGQFGLDLAGGKRLVIEPTSAPASTEGDPWAAIDAIRVVETVDYH
jgi:proteic killer suppression protein